MSSCEWSLGTALCVPLISIALPTAAQAPAGPATFTEANRDAASEDDVRLSLTAGGTFAYGNSRTLGLNVAAAFLVREAAEQLDLEITYLLGMAEAPLTCNDDPMGIGCGGVAGGARTGGFAGTWIENANNLIWRARYDHFFDPDNSIFAAHRGRRDTFAGLDGRFGIQLGYTRVLFREENHRLALDLGVDGTVDVYTDAVARVNRAGASAVPPTFTPPLLQGTDARFVPAVRVNLTYTNHVNEVLTYDTSLEVLWNVVNPGHFRFDWQNHIRSRINGVLELSLDLTLRVDAQPPGQNSPWVENPGVLGTDMRLRPGQVTGMFDFISTLNLVGTIDLDGEPAAVPEEPACPEPPPCPVCARSEACPALEPPATVPGAAEDASSSELAPATEPVVMPGTN